MVFQCINIRQVPLEVFGLGFQHLPRDLANVNAWKTMFDPYNSVYTQEQNSSVLRVHFSEPIQSRCAVLRYSKLTDAQILKRLLEVCEQEHVDFTDDGLEAIVFTAQGDMRQV